jgi:fimbrial chaperone protein
MRRRPVLVGLGLVLARKTARADVVQAVSHNVEISPTTLGLGGPGSTTTCTVLNNGNALTSSQIRLRQWYQSYGQDVLAETSDVVASPPFMSLQPGDSQVVRVANLSAQPSGAEMCYRLLLNELPSVGSLNNNGVTVLIAFSLPVFVAGANAAPPQLSATFTTGTDGRPVLRLVNAGDVHARLADVSYDAGGKRVFTLPGLVAYVLPHSSRDVVLPLQAVPAPGGALSGQTQLQTVATQIDLH